jgi:hypothetical protein
MQKKVIICDVDETICNSCQIIKPDMANTINQLIQKGYTFAFISGTKESYLKEMISTSLNHNHFLLPTTGTKCIQINQDSNTNHYEHSLNQEEKNKVINALNQLTIYYNIQSLTTKEDQIQDRGSQITLSAIGRHAPKKLKEQHDKNTTKRQLWVKYLKTILDENEWEINIAGTTSIDITKKGYDKGWGIKQFAKNQNIQLNHILFFGDKTKPGGNDYPATKVVDFIEVNNPNETLEHFKNLLNQE